MATKNIQMRLSEQTLREVDHIKRNTGVENRTRIVTSGVKLLDTVTDAISKGETVWIEDKKGNKRQVMMIM